MRQLVLCGIVVAWELLGFGAEALGQTLPPEAPEKWALPVKVALPIGAGEVAAPTLTHDGRTIFFDLYGDTIAAGIYSSTFSDTGWTAPARLNSNVNSCLAHNPSISPDGKRLYLSAYNHPSGTGGWDLFYSMWDSLGGDWGPPVNLGPNINLYDVAEWGCMTPDNRVLYWNRYGSPPRVSEWDDSMNAWGPSRWVDFYQFYSVFGRPAVPTNQRKLYYDPFLSSENPFDICVHYFDTTSHAWGPLLTLNLNAAMDSIAPTDRRAQRYPWISPDGRTIWFTSNHGGKAEIWMSRLLVGENGDPVSVSRTEYGVPLRGGLLGNYPNPFNTSTAIQFTIGKTDLVCLFVYNSIGQLIRILVDEIRPAGWYQVIWDGLDQAGGHVPSGSYFLQLLTPSVSAVKGMLVIR